MDELLEREAELALLADALESVRDGGRVVLVAGEAGIGKTALLRRFRADSPSQTRFLWGACDPLFTPRPLGAFVDIATEPVESGARAYEVADALMADLRRATPTVLVLEDVHAADEATLDVLRLLARRVDRVNALVVVSYRNDELDRDHPLRIVLGELAS